MPANGFMIRLSPQPLRKSKKSSPSRGKITSNTIEVRAQRRAGAGFSDPEFPLPIEWLETRSAIQQAEKRQKSPKSNSRILLINGSTRSDQTCPGEMSKTFRLAKMAEKYSGNKGVEVDLLDLSRLASEYGRIIYPCKACVSTAMPLCTGPAPAIQTTPWDRSTIGWRKFIHVGPRRME